MKTMVKVANEIQQYLLRLVALLSFLLTGLSAQAVEYTFSATSNSFPASCSYVSAGNYTCANLLLIAGDTVVMEPNAPAVAATINILGTFVITGATVNVGGLASDLNIVAIGTVAVGTALVITNTQVNANVSSMAAINIYSSSVIGGNLSANTTTGIITLATNTTVVGDVYTDAGAITLGIGTHVAGNLFSTGAGVISLGAGVTVVGDVSTAVGAITIGVGGVVGGEVFSTGAGVITTATDVSVAGSLSSFDGAISLGIGTQVDGGVSSSGGGVLTLSANVMVGLDVISAVGAIAVGNGSSVGGDVGSIGPGVVTLGANITVGGDIFTVAGGITIGDNTTVVGSVSSSGAGVLTLTTNVVVGGSVTSAIGAVDIGGGSAVCGDVGSTGDGVITLTTNVGVGGGVNSVAGGITIGAGSTVQLSVRITGAGVMTITGVEVGGDLYTLVGAITGTTSLVRGHITQSDVHSDRAWSHQINLVVAPPTACDALFPPPPPPPPDILILKSVQVYSDPINLQNNPKAIPGAVMLYTIQVINRGGGGSDMLVITDPMPANTVVFANDINGAGSGPLLFTQGTSLSGLSYAFNGLASTTDNISFSSDNGVSYGYTPLPNVDGYDIAVTDIKISLSGTFTASSGAPHPSFGVSFRVTVQ
ncbi:MAG: hypothetical protein ACJAYC_002809 [Halieaceae bacterium]|jgi:hypothetical protein